jgi:hypothetical protein
LTWDAVSGNANTGYSSISNYKVYSNGGGVGTTFTSIDTPSTNTASIIGLLPSTSYTFKVSAVNLQGEGPLSTEIVTSTVNTPNKPDAAVITQDTSTQNIRVTWTAPSDNGDALTGYIIDFTDYLNGKATFPSCDGTSSPIFTQ